MKVESFNFSIDEYSTELTCHSHQTIYWLNRNGYLNGEQTVDLVSRMVVVPVRNNKKFGQRLLDRLFNRESDERDFVFPITLLEPQGTYEGDDDSEGKNNVKKFKIIK